LAAVAGREGFMALSLGCVFVCATWGGTSREGSVREQTCLPLTDGDIDLPIRDIWANPEVSRLCGELDVRVNAFLGWLIEGDWPYLWIDATCVKTRGAGRVVSVAATVAVGVNAEIKRRTNIVGIFPNVASIT